MSPAFIALPLAVVALVVKLTPWCPALTAAVKSTFPLPAPMREVVRSMRSFQCWDPYHASCPTPVIVLSQLLPLPLPILLGRFFSCFHFVDEALTIYFLSCCVVCGCIVKQLIMSYSFVDYASITRKHSRVS